MEAAKLLKEASDAVFETFSQSKSTQDTAYRPTFLQIHQHGGGANVGISSGRMEAAKLLKEAVKSSQSKRLPMVVAALQAENPFTTVLSQIDKMLVLIDEEEKADQKGYDQCNHDIKDLKDDQSDTESELNLKEMQVYQKKRDSASTAKKIATTESLLQTERQKMITMTATRTAENLDYQTDVKNLQDAEIILTKAVKVLKTYYDDLESKIAKGQAGAAGLLQKSSRQPSESDREFFKRKHQERKQWQRSQYEALDSAEDGTALGSYAGQKK